MSKIEELIKQFPDNYEEMHNCRDNWPALKELLPSALEQIKILQEKTDKTSQQQLANLAHNVGVFFTHVIANYDEGLRLLRLAITIKKNNSYGFDSYSLAETHTQLADCAYRHGEYVLAINSFSAANEILERNYGDKRWDLQRAFVLHASANAYYNIGAYPKALAVLQESNEIRKCYLPDNAIEFGYLKHDLADVLTAQGYFDKAEKLFASALEIKKNFFQTDAHPNIALLYQCQALMNIKNRQFDSAQTNLELAYTIYTAHYQQLATNETTDLFRNYFYTIILLMAQGKFPDAETKIAALDSQLQPVYSLGTHPGYIRLMQETIQLYQNIDQLEKAVEKLETLLLQFIPHLKINSAPNILSLDNKFNIACLLSQYGLLLFIKNNYQDFEQSMHIINMARRLKTDFYNALTEPGLSILNDGFSDYDEAVLNYFGASTINDGTLKSTRLRRASDSLRQAENKFTEAGMDKRHNSLLACSKLGTIINDLRKPDPGNRRLSFFPYFSEYNKDCIPYPNTLLNYYP